MDLLIRANHQIRWSLERGRILREGRFPCPRTAAFRIAPDRRYVTVSPLASGERGRFSS